MANFRTQIQTKASAAQAFAYLEDFSNARFWDPTVVRASVQSKRPIQVGSRFQVVVALAGSELEFDYELLTHEPKRRLVLQAETDWLRSTDTIEFEPLKQGCRVTYDADLRLLGAAYLFDLPAHLLFQYSGANSAKGLAKALDALKREKR